MSGFYETSPVSWSRHRLRFLMDGCQNGAWGSEAGEDTEDAICVRVADFVWEKRSVSLEKPTLRSFPKSQINKLSLRNGDLLIEKSGGGEKTPVGRVVGYCHDDLAVSSNFVARIRPKSVVSSKFFLYLLAAQYISGYSRQFIKQNTGIQNLDDSAWFANDVWLPDLPTQKAIADFLDRETARIDQLIEKKQRMVEVLGEREENNVVETIEHLFAESRAWKISHVCALKRGRFNQRPRNAPEFYDGDFPFLQTSDVAQAKKYISGHKQTLTDLGASVSVLFPSNSVLMAIAANVGDVAITKFDAYCPDSVIGFIPTTRLRVDYLYYALRSLRSSIATSSTSNAQDNTNISRLGALKIPVPKHATQDRVSGTLSVQENSTVRLIAMTHTSIDRLREFRSALITAAVTGQIDVSTWSKQGTTGRSLDQIEEATSA